MADGRITKELAVKARNDIKEMIQDYLSSHGWTSGRSSVSYGEADMTIKLQINGSDRSGQTKEQHDWNLFAPLYSLPVEGLGVVVDFGGRVGRARVAGIAPKNRKYPLLVTCVSNGKTYKMPTNTLTAEKISAAVESL